MKNTHFAKKEKTKNKKPTKPKKPQRKPKQNPKEVYVYVAFLCRLNSNVWTSLVRLHQLIFHPIII